MWQRILTYIKETRVEFHHVNWPARPEAIRLTGVVVGFSIGLALFLGAFDFLFGSLLRQLILR